MDPTQDIHRDKPEIERVRELSHGDGGLSKDCDRYEKPIYVEPNRLPEPCAGGGPKDYWGNGPTCGNESWNSNGIVLRDKKSGHVVHREKLSSTVTISADGHQVPSTAMRQV